MQMRPNPEILISLKLAEMREAPRIQGLDQEKCFWYSWEENGYGLWGGNIVLFSGERGVRDGGWLVSCFLK